MFISFKGYMNQDLKTVLKLKYHLPQDGKVQVLLLKVVAVGLHGAWSENV
jgi:hypothetical protein